VQEQFHHPSVAPPESDPLLPLFAAQGIPVCSPDYKSNLQSACEPIRICLFRLGLWPTQRKYKGISAAGRTQRMRQVFTLMGVRCASVVLAIMSDAKAGRTDDYAYSAIVHHFMDPKVGKSHKCDGQLCTCMCRTYVQIHTIHSSHMPSDSARISIRPKGQLSLPIRFGPISDAKPRF
jgi:hypothetical protein